MRMWGDLLVLRAVERAEFLPNYLHVMFSATPSQSIRWQDSEEIVVEMPSGPAGEVAVSVWLGLIPVSNITSFCAELEPIVYRILAFGDSMGDPGRSTTPTCWIRC